MRARSGFGVFWRRAPQRAGRQASKISNNKSIGTIPSNCKSNARQVAGSILRLASKNALYAVDNQSSDCVASATTPITTATSLSKVWLKQTPDIGPVD